MKKLLHDEPSTADLIIIWKAQAYEIATISNSPDPVWRFLESKHIPKHEASVAAIMIWNEAQKSRGKTGIPWLVAGIALVGVGLVYAFLMYQSSPVFVMVAVAPVIFGVGMLWNVYSDWK